MREIVREVNQVRAIGAETRDDLERFGDREMRRMRAVAQGIEHQGGTPSSSGQVESGIRLQSVRYANAPIRKPRIGREP